MINSEAEDSKEDVERDFGLFRKPWSANGANEDGESLHSGLIMIPVIPSSKTGLSVPDIVRLLFPLSDSRSPVHYLFKIFVLRSKSSGLKVLLELC